MKPLGTWPSLEAALRAHGVTMEEFTAFHKQQEDQLISDALGERSEIEFISETWDRLPAKTRRDIMLILIRGW